MKRRREADVSEIRSAIQELSQPQTHLAVAIEAPLKPFLSLCSLLLQVLDKIGPTMAVLREDVHHNIQRLERFHDSNPSIYSNAGEILSREFNEGTAKKGHSCSKAFVWLTRSLELALALLQQLLVNKENMEEAVEESYALTLKPWHGWISSAAYRIALKLVPSSHSLLNILKAGDDDDDALRKDIQVLASLLLPFLEKNKDIMRMYGLDTLKCT